MKFQIIFVYVGPLQVANMNNNKEIVKLLLDYPGIDDDLEPISSEFILIIFFVNVFNKVT